MPRNNRFFAFCAFGVFAIFSVAVVGQDAKKKADPPSDQSTTAEKSEPASTEGNSDDRVRPDFNSGKLRFEYKNTDWAKVIRGFAEEAMLDLNMPVTPEGSFTYSSNGEFTLLEAMDLINSFLMREQNFVLIRHANMIFVHDLNVEIPSTMIETIPLTELSNRGRFEMTQTEFDVSGIDADSFFDQIQPLVRDQGGKSLLLPLSNVLFVRETGEQLRLIQRFLEMARTGKEEVLKILPLKHAMPEEILTIAAELMPLDDENSYKDEEKGESLKVIVLAFESQFILSGTAKAVEKFEKIVNLRDIEVAAASDATADLAQPKIFRYPVASDLELNLQVVRAALAGTEGLRLQAAAEAGQIIAYGTEAHNKKILEVLDGLRTASNEFRVVKLYDYDADSMIEILNKLYGVSETAEEVDPNAPVFMADPLYSDQLIVKAKPTQVEAIQKFVGSLDPEPSASQYSQKNYLRLDYKGNAADRAIQEIQDLIDVTKRTNKLDVRRSAASGGGLRPINRDGEATQPQSQPEIQPMKSNPAPKSTIKPSVTRSESFQRRGGRLNVFARVPVQQEDQKKTADPVESPADGANDDEEKSGEIKSVPGAPVIIKETATGILVISDDLEMLAAIEQWLKETEPPTTAGLPRIVELKFRKAVEMKDLLEMFLGLSSDSSGGGGGGLGGMLGGLAQNAIGGAAGQMLGGLMGGGGGGGGSTATTSDMLTGDASIAADAQLNVLVVSANDVDFDLIMQYVDYFDVDGPENDPFLDGRTYSIPVEYRDASELVELIKTMLPDRIKSPKQQGGGNPQAAQAQMLQQLMRGGRGGGNQGGGNKGVEQTEPKMTLGADLAVNAVLVTGPEFLFKQVDEIVKTLDTPVAQGKEQMVVVPLKNMSSTAIKSLVDSMNATSGQEPSQNAATNRNRTATGGGAAASTGNPQVDAMRAFGERMRAMQQGGGGRGGIQGASPFGGGGRGGRGGTTGGGGRGGRGGR